MTRVPLRAGLLIAALTTIVVASSITVASALYSDSAPATGNSFSTASCFGPPKLKGVQRGTTTNTGTNTNTITNHDVTIASVDTTKAFLIFSTRHADDAPAGSGLRGRIANSTTLTFVRNNNDSAGSIAISWAVVEYSCGVRVQRGEFDGSPSTATINQTLGTSVAVDRSFVLTSRRTQGAGGSWDADDTMAADLTSATNVQFRFGSSSNSAQRISWQVVEFQQPGSALVQRGSITGLTAGVTSATATLATPVDLTRSFVLGTFTSTATGVEIGERLVRTRLTATDTVTVDRNESTEAVGEVHYQVVQLNDGSTVQAGSSAFADTVGAANHTLALVDLSRATAFGSTEISGQNGGRSSYITTARPGAGAATFVLASTTQLTATRSHTSGTAEIGWFVVEWGRPSEIKSVQRGTATSTANGTTTVTVAAVDTTKSVLWFSARHNAARPPGSSVLGRVANGTTLQFVQVSDVAFTIVVDWVVVEYERGVKVQRGSIAQSATTHNTTITAVAATNLAFTTWSKTTSASSNVWAGDDPVVLELTSTTNLQLRADATANPSHEVAYQVVEFTSASVGSVQRGTTSMATGVASATGTLTTVDTAKSFVLADLRNNDTGASVGTRLVRARITSPIEITIDRGSTVAPLTETTWQVVSMKDGTAVQSGSASFATGTGVATAGLTTLSSVGRAIAFASGQVGTGQSGGRSPYVGNDIPGVASATLALTSATELTLTRNNTANTADIAWFVLDLSAVG